MRRLLPFAVLFVAALSLTNSVQAQSLLASRGLGSPRERATTAHQPIALGTYYWDNGLCAPGDAGAVTSWKAQTGRLPAVWMIYQGWTGWNRFPVEQAQRARNLGATLMVTWEPWSGRNDDASWNCARVAGGAYDNYIRNYARDVKKAGVPVMIRLAHEMNGDWYPWATAFKNRATRHNGNSPEQYTAMWRRVVAIFRAEGATNARWVWAPNIVYMNGANSLPAQKRDLAALYPGDEWADWIGLSVYNDGAKRPWRSFDSLFSDSYATLAAISHKPMMIAEIGVTEQGAPRGESKARWIEQTFLEEIPFRYPRVQLVNYFSRDKTAHGESNYRFDSSGASLQAFRRVALSPLYQGQIER